MKPHNYWIIFTAKGELAVDENGVAMCSCGEKLLIGIWDEKNPQDAPHKAIEYAPLLPQ